ncbi:hypothetical protein [Maribacter sp. HTCC2170]|uniref:hypothetical protein n=1 Tax=Maribacter sp. (strain HTCC2170 / KCCM 42371) TaxID=313603 RepID=UPI00006AFD23|nr:hypothetical protein [Maribacter sp. HTCC2170]EAR01209.1 hypothetical protein FB2170_10831 [Maribacter sp. HTCC2170]
MAFLKRLGFYLFGLAIGLVFLTIFFKNKTEGTGVEFCYFPNCRTLKDIRSKPLSYSDDVEDLINSQQLDSLKISHFLREGEVDFKKSNTKSSPCKTYIIEAELDDKEAIMTIKNCPDSALIESIVF